MFNGANIDEKIDISANGSRVRFTRDVANITMDLNGVERINFNALGGADTITVDDLTGTDVKQVNLDLGGSPAAAATARPTRVIVNGTDGADNDQGRPANGTDVTVTGLAAAVTIIGTEAANDALTVNALGGNDTIDASGLAAGELRL